MDRNISADRCSTVKRVRNDVHTMFILLKPRSHSAVLTGIVFTLFINLCTAAFLILPPPALKSRYAPLTSLKSNENLSHKTCNSGSPNSGESSSVQLLGSRTETILHRQSNSWVQWIELIAVIAMLCKHVFQAVRWTR